MTYHFWFTTLFMWFVNSTVYITRLTRFAWTCSIFYHILQTSQTLRRIHLHGGCDCFTNFCYSSKLTTHAHICWWCDVSAAVHAKWRVFGTFVTVYVCIINFADFALTATTFSCWQSCTSEAVCLFLITTRWLCKKKWYIEADFFKQIYLYYKKKTS